MSVVRWIERSNDAVTKWPFRWMTLIVMMLIISYSQLTHICVVNNVPIAPIVRTVNSTPVVNPPFLVNPPSRIGYFGGIIPPVVPYIPKDNVDAFVNKVHGMQKPPINKHTAGIHKGWPIWTDGT